MTDTNALLKFEEGYSATPYRDSEGYPTVAIGIRIGPKGAPLANYCFTVPLVVAEAWTDTFVDSLLHQIDTNPKYVQIKGALAACQMSAVMAPIKQNPRCAVVISMAYQMGLDGLMQFVNTLGLMVQHQFNDAADNMLKSKWASQTPKRAKRHADQMRSNVWAKEYV